MDKVFLEYDEAKDNYKIVVFVGSEELTLDGDDVRVPAKVRVAYDDPIEPKVDDDWFGATLPSGRVIDINLWAFDRQGTFCASVYPVDEDGHIDTAHPLMSCDKISFIEKEYYSGWSGCRWVVAKNQSQEYSDGNTYSEGFTLYMKHVEIPFLGTDATQLEEVGTSYTVESLVEKFIFREI